MTLKLRPTGLGHGVYKDTVDYGVFSGEWCIGRIYETRTGPPELRWFWALHAPKAESSGRRNELVGRSEKFVKCLCGRFPFECLARPCIEGRRHGGDLISTVSA